MKVQNKHNILKAFVNASRFVLAAVFVFSGFVKAVDPLGTQYKILDYLTAFGVSSYFPHSIVLLISVVLSSIEFLLGVSLFFGIKRTISSTFILAYMMVMTPLTLYLALFNPVSDCGCFGDALRLTNWQTFIKNVVLLVASYLVFVYRKQIIRFVSVKTEWLVLLYSALFIIGLVGYCLDDLPIIDFRPYRIGVNIKKAMSIPVNAEPSVYKSKFILEKNGLRKEYTLDNYPDSTWTFVETKTVLKKQGYVPPIHDFSISELNTGKDITDSVLSNTGYVFLLVVHRIEEASDSYIDLINEIYDYSVENGYGFYALTSSSKKQIEKWKDRTGAEYDFYLTDDITLKTMIRSNPGLLLIKNGTILNKWSDTHLPDEYTLTNKLEKLDIGKQRSVNDVYTVNKAVFWFFVPLVIVLGLDIILVRRQNKRNKKKSNKIL
ncbi:MAG: BT_3928 family protein [Bacteroidaceae bacterium]|nr:DoxX family protein [Bacteroidaceae bacterium]